MVDGSWLTHCATGTSTRRTPRIGAVVLILSTSLVPRAAAAVVGGTVTTPTSAQIKIDPSVRLAASNTCVSTCDLVMWLEYRGTNPSAKTLPQVTSIESIDPTGTGFPELGVTLAFDLPPIADLVLVARRLVLRDGSYARGEFSVRPQVRLDAARSARLAYAGLRRRPPAEVTPESVTLTITDADDGSQVTRTVTRVEPGARRKGHGAEDTTNFSLLLDHELPRGRQLNVVVEGIDFVPARTHLSTAARPQSSAEADIVLGGTAIFPHDGDESFGTEVKLSHTWFFDKWDFVPDFQAKIASDGLSYPDTASATLGFRRWFLGSPAPRPERSIERQSLYLGPAFRTDKPRDNQQLGVVIAWEPVFTTLYQPLQRRALNASPGLTPKFGYTVKVRPLLEGGWQIKSEEKQVEGTGYFRPGVALDATFEFREVSLVVAYWGRGLLTEEVTIDEDEVVRVGKGFRQLLDLELGRSFGALKVAVNYTIGSEPPAFKHANAITINLKALF